MADALAKISTRTPQIVRADEKQVPNSAGGFVFPVDDAVRLNRFLTLGSAGGTFYVSEERMTKDNADIVLKMAVQDGLTLVNEIVKVSVAGRAPKVQPAIFALAIAASHGDDATRKAALDSVELVCRTGTHLFLFVKYSEQFRGWGRGLRRAVSKFYERDTDTVAYQVLKYRQREGWTHRDLLRLAHPKAVGGWPKEVLFEWICGRETSGARPELLDGFIKAQEPGANLAQLIADYPLSWEMLPDEALTKIETWEALFVNKRIPLGALMRQLPRLTNLGFLPAKGGYTDLVAKQLSSTHALKKARVHPINVLIAHKTYEGGKSLKGSSTWKPTGKIVDALDAGFYAAYGAIEPTGKRTMLALDVSGSMSWATISNLPISPREASAALALVTANVEKDYLIVGFTSGRSGFARRNSALTELAIKPKQRLSSAVQAVSELPFGGTDCSLPFVVAKERGLKIDTFCTYTDNETWAGAVHPHEALQSYRDSAGIPARSVVVGMTSTNFSIADPKDAGMLDVAGFDSAVPQLISDFARGV